MNSTYTIVCDDLKSLTITVGKKCNVHDNFLSGCHMNQST